MAEIAHKTPSELELKMPDSSNNIQVNKVPETILNTVREYAAYAKTLLPECGVMLFGSQVKGTATENSDIDVAIVCDDMSYLSNEEFFDILGKLWGTAYKMNSKIEPHIINASNDPLGFLDEIVNTGIFIG